MIGATHWTAADSLRAGAVVLIWGLNFVVMKLGLQGLSPMLLGALRFALASLPLLLFVPRPQVPGRFVLLYGAVQGLGQFGLLFLAIAWGMPAGMASLVMQMQAFFTLLLAVPLLGERAARAQWAGLVIGAVGLALIASAHGQGPQAMSLLGFVLTLGASLMWALSNLVVRFAARRAPDYDPLAFIVWSSLVPVLPFGLLSLWVDGPQATARMLAGLGWREAFAVAFLAWLATLLAYSLWTRLLKRHAAARVAPFTLLVPVVGLAAAWVVFGEQLAPVQWAGALLVGAGLLVNQFGGRLRQRLRGAAPAAPR